MSLFNWPFETLSPGHYQMVLADPPWQFETYSEKGEGKSAQAHYEVQHLDWIKSLPVMDLAHLDRCVCVIWATAPMLPQGLETLRAWGFRYKTAGAWAKQSSTGKKLAFGTGYIYRNAAEFFLLGTRGHPKQISRSIRNLILAPVREHSRKPDQMHADLEALFQGPRCELFPRQQRPGWDAWGNQTTRFNQQEAA